MIENFSENVIDKAKTVKLPDIKPDEADDSIWWVTSQRTGKKERVQFIGDDWVTCSCENGSRRGGQAACYHAAAAEMLRNNDIYQESLTEGDDDD